MKITCSPPAPGCQLGNLNDGELFHFCRYVHQGCEHTDVCLKVYIPGSYIPMEERYENKVAVVNLTKNKLMLVSPDRPVIKLKGELHVQGGLWGSVP